MKKISIWSIAILAILGFSGCGSATNSTKVPIVKTTEQFQLSNVTLKLTQSINPRIQYYTEEEIQKIFTDKLTSLLIESKLLSNKESSNSLVITANYNRRFVGEGSPFISDSIRYPLYAYVIKVFDGNKKLSELARKELSYDGGLAMNLKIIGGTLRTKKDEDLFIEVFANTVFKSIKNIEFK